MINPIYENVNNTKLIISRKRIINSIASKIQTHQEYVEMYQDRIAKCDPRDPDYQSKSKKAKVNIWRHQKEIQSLQPKLVRNQKILQDLQQKIG